MRLSQIGLLLFLATALGGQNLLSGGETTGSPGASGVPLQILLTNTAPVAGVQFDLVLLPELAVDSLRQTGRGGALNDLSFARRGDTLRVLLFSLTLDSIPPGSGAILDLFLTIAPSAPWGTFELPLIHAALSDPRGNNLPVTTAPAILVIQGTGVAEGRETSLPTSQPMQVRVFDASGRLRARFSPPPSLPLRGYLTQQFPTGVYWVEILGAQGGREVRKVWLLNPHRR